MHSLQPEMAALRAVPGLDQPRLERRHALESGAQFSVHGELRVAFYVAVMLIVAGAGLLVARNLARIGPPALTLALLVAAAVCYAFAWRTRRAGRERSTGADYVLLLGALLLSTAAGYAELQFHWAGRFWSLQLLLIALVHACSAYYFDSRLLLSVALTAIAAWFGVETGPRVLEVWDLPTAEAGWRALACALTVLFWRIHHGHQDHWRSFDALFEHFAANLALLGCIGLATGADPWLGLALALTLGTLCMRWGLVRQEALFLAYGVIYPSLVVCILLVRNLHSWQLSSVAVLAATCGAAVLLWQQLTRLNTRGRG
jgi:hypothetical protein